MPENANNDLKSIKGEITAISELPQDSLYLLKVTFPQGLVTSSKRRLPFRNGMSATGEIVTEDLRLIERLFYDFRRMLKR